MLLGWHFFLVFLPIGFSIESFKYYKMKNHQRLKTLQKYCACVGILMRHAMTFFCQTL